jgi:seryl-tRNA synthetase
MLDVSLLRTDAAALAEAMRRRGITVDVDALVALDEERRRLRVDAENLRSQQKEIGKSIQALSGSDKEAAIAEAGALAEGYKVRLAEADACDEQFLAQWVRLPNVPDATAADGTSEEDAVVVGSSGSPPEFGFEPADHVAIGVSLGLIDVERAAKISGSRFGYLKGELALLEFALVRWAMEMLQPHGFVPVIPPVLVREDALYGTGFFPGDEEQVYSVPEDDLFLVGTSEVPLAAMHMDEIFEGADLPVRYAGFSTCFRREAGTYGKDTAGIFRVHQFDKVEMFSFVHPDRSTEEHEFLLAREEELVSALDIPYRVMNIAAGDLGASAAKKYDIEAWFPGQGRYREITSTSNTTDYQSRRLRIRFKDDGGGNRLVHTLNGTAVAIGRTLIAIVENNQTGEGTVTVPDVLRPYVGFDSIG